MKRHLRLCLIALSLVLSITPGTQAGPYTFTTIDSPGATDTGAAGINSTGQIVGVYFPAGRGGNPPFHGYSLTGGVYSTIDFPGANTGTAPFRINDAGQVVGYYTPNINGGFDGGFLLSAGIFSSIDFPSDHPVRRTRASGINNHGQIVGTYERERNMQHGFLLNGGVFSTFDFPGSIETEAFGINDAGKIVGVYQDGVTGHGFLLSAGLYTTIDFPGAPETVALGINDGGQIVGQYVDAHGGALHGFLLSGGIFSTIDFPGASGTGAVSINDAAQIVGSYGDAGGAEHGFLADPVPEPSTFTLLGLGTVGLLSCAWRSRRVRVPA